MTRLRRVRPDEVADILRAQDPVDAATLVAAARIVEDVQQNGWQAVLSHATRLGDIETGRTAPIIYDRAALNEARAALPAADRALLERIAARITTFARAQRACLMELDVEVAGGRAGHSVAPVERAGCYAPGGRFPLPSSVLMTVATARAAGVATVWVASPKPTTVTLAAAAIADADALLAVGGAQAIAALTFGAGEVPPCDAIVGPGNRFVTAAKKLVAGRVAIDMLAGPSELVVVADEAADASTIAADLLAQAEHDPDALPVLVTWSAALADAVDRELATQLATLPTRATAEAALRDNGFSVIVADVDEAVHVCNVLAPEHLEVQTRQPDLLAPRLLHYGALFLGDTAAEVFGDYGVGPNHVLPTSRSARFTGGLSVMNFLRVRTWLRMQDIATVRDDTARLARLEGLEAHARAALRRT